MTTLVIQSPPNCCCDNTNNNISVSNGANLHSSNGGTMMNNNLAGVGVRASPRERLEAFAADFDMLKPLLMYNIENIKSFRADCKYNTNRKSRSK